MNYFTSHVLFVLRLFGSVMRLRHDVHVYRTEDCSTEASEQYAEFRGILAVAHVEGEVRGLTVPRIRSRIGDDRAFFSHYARMLILFVMRDIL